MDELLGLLMSMYVPGRPCSLEFLIDFTLITAAKRYVDSFLHEKFAFDVISFLLAEVIRAWTGIFHKRLFCVGRRNLILPKVNSMSRAHKSNIIPIWTAD